GAGANVDVAAVAAYPDLLAHAAEDLGLLDILEQGAVTLLVLLLDGGDALHLHGDGHKALLAGDLGELGVHLGPLVILAGGGQLQILGGGADFAARHVLVPELGMLLLVAGGLGEEGGDLLIAVLLRLRGIVLIFYTGLR